MGATPDVAPVPPIEIGAMGPAATGRPAPDHTSPPVNASWLTAAHEPYARSGTLVVPPLRRGLKAARLHNGAPSRGLDDRGGI